jgi:hypothetical protein
MSKRTKLAIFISAAAAVVSAVVLIVLFWDKLLAKCPCKKDYYEVDLPEEAEEETEEIVYDEEELADFADLEAPEAE